MKISRYLINLESRNGNTIWYHPVSKALLYFPVRYSQKSKDTLRRIGSRDEIALRKMMFLFPDNFDEGKFYKYWYKNLQYSGQLLSFTIHTTFDCNLSCMYCYEKSLSRDASMSDPSAVARWIIDLVNRKRPQNIDVCYIGGEPLINVKAIEKIALELNGLNSRISSVVVTNGTLLNEQLVKKLKKLGISKYQVTIDGPAEIHDKLRPFDNGRGSFSEIIRNISQVDDLCEISLNINLSKGNAHSVKELLSVLEKEKLKVKLMFSVVFEEQRNCLGHGMALDKQNIEWLRSHKDAIANGYSFAPFYRNTYGPCTLYRENYFVIAPDGTLYKCSAGVGNKKYKIGHISDSQNLIVKARTAQFLEKDHSLASCKDCNFAPNCDSGCSFQAELSGSRQCNKLDFLKNDLPLIREMVAGWEK